MRAVEKSHRIGGVFDDVDRHHDIGGDLSGEIVGGAAPQGHFMTAGVRHRLRRRLASEHDGVRPAGLERPQQRSVAAADIEYSTWSRWYGPGNPLRVRHLSRVFARLTGRVRVERVSGRVE